VSYREAEYQFLQWYWRTQLDDCNCNITHVARASGVHRDSVYRYLRRLNIHIPGRL
jgi:transcriptional regulator of acetoin/glycerol metabolism